MAESARTRRPLTLVVLAAGEGKRLRSVTPKVLHPVCGRSVLWHVVQTASAVRPDRIVIVVPQHAEAVRDEVASWRLMPKPVFVEQSAVRGTADAVEIALPAVRRGHDVLVANGDFDPVRPDDVRALLRTHRRTGSAATLLTTVLDDPGSYGRVIRDARGRFLEIDEDRRTPGADAIQEVGTNWIVFDRRALASALPEVGNDTRQRERYLNHVYPVLRERGLRVTAVSADTGGVLGANSRSGLAALERLVRERINARHMANGVTLVDPDATYIDVDVEIGRDSVIQPNTFLERGSRIGRMCGVGPSVAMSASTIGDGSVVRFSVLEGATVGRGCEVGPFARLREGAVLDDGAQVGNYVEVKSSRLGRDAKAKHLTYLGNAEIGEYANIGAGTVTVNYDGYDKHVTTIGDGARIGSDTMLVAPVTVGRNAATAAGSVITNDVPDGALAVERTEQRTVEGYRARKDAEHRRRRRGKRS